MTHNNEQQSQFRLGFLTAVEVPEQGYVGGLLVTNRYGRPLEFQCTTPVKPNRTQEILYGPTLRPFLFGELIGRTLVESVSVRPELVLTEQPEFLELRGHVDVPVACLVPDDGRGTRDEGREMFFPHPSTLIPHPSSLIPQHSSLVPFGRQRLRFHSAHSSDRSLIETHGSLISDDADLREPFQRVREALHECVIAPQLQSPSSPHHRLRGTARDEMIQG